LDREIKNIKETNKRVLGEIDEIKKKGIYIENLKKQEEIKIKREEVEKEILKWREIIDFKTQVIYASLFLGVHVPILFLFLNI